MKQRCYMSSEFNYGPSSKYSGLDEPSAVEEYDVLIVGGGPAGLSAAIKLKQMASLEEKELSVCLLEKGGEIGAHILSGCVLEPTAFNELFPNWKDLGEDERPPLDTPVKSDCFYLLTEKSSFKMMTPPAMHNEGNYIISLGNLCRWMGERAEEMDVDIFPGIAGSKPVLSDDGRTLLGIRTNDVGIGKDGEKTANYEPGMELRAKMTLLAEGCRGSLSTNLIDHFSLDFASAPQAYGIGLKEIWEVPDSNHNEGHVMHTGGWPLDLDTYGGSFVYHAAHNQIFIGLVIGLDYKNPYIHPYKEFQRFKHHPLISKVLEGGRCVSYGARALAEGGIQSIPRLVFPGGALIGDSAGFMNVPKVKGTHTAMKSGIEAAECAFRSITATSEEEKPSPLTITDYNKNMKTNWVGKELKKVRNIRPSFAKWGFLGGLMWSGIDSYLLKGRIFNFKTQHDDSDTLKLAADSKPIDYPKPDGKLSFDLLENLSLSNTFHNEDQPAHLKLENDVAITFNKPQYANPEERFCPAGVYEIVEDEGQEPRLQINAANCLHCKTCDIKDRNITWTVPEGGGGPAYPNM